MLTLTLKASKIALNCSTR